MLKGQNLLILLLLFGHYLIIFINFSLKISHLTWKNINIFIFFYYDLAFIPNLSIFICQLLCFLINLFLQYNKQLLLNLTLLYVIKRHLISCLSLLCMSPLVDIYIFVNLETWAWIYTFCCLCLFIYSRRTSMMSTSSIQLSAWVFSLNMISCIVALILVFIVIIYGCYLWSKFIKRWSKICLSVVSEVAIAVDSFISLGDTGYFVSVFSFMLTGIHSLINTVLLSIEVKRVGRRAAFPPLLSSSIINQGPICWILFATTRLLSYFLSNTNNGLTLSLRRLQFVGILVDKTRGCPTSIFKLIWNWIFSVIRHLSKRRILHHWIIINHISIWISPEVRIVLRNVYLVRFILFFFRFYEVRV